MPPIRPLRPHVTFTNRQVRQPPPAAFNRKYVVAFALVVTGVMTTAFLYEPNPSSVSEARAAEETAIMVATRNSGRILRMQGQIDALETRIKVMEVREAYQSPLEAAPLPGQPSDETHSATADLYGNSSR